MQTYVREDGVTCEAVRFEGYVSGGAEHIFSITQLFHAPGYNAGWHPEEETDEWIEGEDGEPEQVVIPEHIKTINDMLKVGDYAVKRDGDVYVMAGELFEAIWSYPITDAVDDWEWNITGRLPYAKNAGYFEHKYDPDVVSTDGGVTYFRLSEVPLYHTHGEIYTSIKKENAIEG